jgi:hypothetical protein
MLLTVKSATEGEDVIGGVGRLCPASASSASDPAIDTSACPRSGRPSRRDAIDRSAEDLLDKFNDESAFRSFVKSEQFGESGSDGTVRMNHLDAALLCGAA